MTMGTGEIVLWTLGTVQIVIALLNLGLVRMLDWRPELARLSLLAREVFHAHVYFISLTVAAFGVMTWSSASEMLDGSESAARRLATVIGFFWIARTGVQLCYYSRSHWIGNRPRTIVHAVCVAVFGSMGIFYLAAGWGSFVP